MRIAIIGVSVLICNEDSNYRCERINNVIRITLVVASVLIMRIAIIVVGVHVVDS